MLQVLLIALSDLDHNDDDHDKQTFEDIPVILMFKHSADTISFD